MGIEAAAHRITQPVEVVAAWEAGTERPTLGALEKLAHLYRRPLATFLRAEPPVEPAPPVDFRTPFGRGDQPLSREAHLAVRKARRIQRLTTYSSMFIQEAYETARIVVDSRDDVGPKLVTTGLIEPNECLWGRAKCRYMKRDYAFPRAPFSADTSRAVQRKLELSRRPKIIVAGLGSRVECFLDAKGEFIGAVSTFSIVHPEDDLDRLAELARVLLHPEVTRLFRSQLGGNAMGGGNITMRKAFLEHLPIARYDDPGVVTRAASAPATSFPVRPGKPQVQYPGAAPALRRAAESTAPTPASIPSPTQGTLADLARTAAVSADWLPEEAVDAASVVSGRRVRHRRFGEGVIIEVRRTAKSPTVTIRFGASDDHEIAIGYGPLEFEAR